MKILFIQLYKSLFFLLTIMTGFMVLGHILYFITI